MQKGAFQTGSTITLQQLTATASNGTNSSQGIVSNNQGAYSLSTDWTGYGEITINGSFYDEYHDQVSTTPISLNGIQPITSGNQNINVNLFTHFVAARIKNRVQNQSETLATAKTQAEAELQTALQLAANNSEQLDLHDGNSAQSHDNAVLLLFSGSFMAAGGNSTLLGTLTDDFKIDGEFDTATLQAIATQAGTAGMINTLASNLSNNGITSPPDTSDLGSLPDWVVPANTAPVANAGSATTAEDTAKTITLIATDADGDNLTYSIVSQSANGTVSISGNTATYTPTANYNGSDSFTYKANDGKVDSNTATVSISIGGTNDAPVANAVSATTAEDTAKAITLTATDADGDSLTYSIVTQPANGTVSITGNIATYTPNANYNGNDSFTYKANDGTADSNTATVNITISAVNDAPIAGGLGISEALDEDTSKSFDLPGYDPDGAPLAVLTGTIVTQPQQGSISITGEQATYTPNANYNGQDSFTYTLNDAQGAVSNQQIFILFINAVNDTPVANAGTDANVIEGQTLTLDGSNSNDIDNDLLNYSWTPTANLDDATKEKPVFTAPAVTTDTQQTFTLTVSDRTVNGLTATDTVTITILNLPAQPQNVQATAGDQQVTLSWDAVSDATAYDLCMATETITDPANCATHQGGTVLADSTSPSVITTLTNNAEYFFVVIPKNTNGDGVASTVTSATPTGVVQPAPTGKLNDTGITLCGDYAYGTGSGNHSNNEDCANTTDAEGDPIPTGQDGHSGRDANAATNDDSDGHKGFSYTKLDTNGVALADQTATTFSCVKDNVTGFIWEVKTNDDGLHDKNDRYNWYNTDNTTNGGSVGFADNNGNICEGYDVNDSATYCNTQAYVTRVNASNSGSGLCGATDWRLPTREELRSIVSYDRLSPAIDTGYFPNTVSSLYWSSSPYAPSSGEAWRVYFNDGNDGAYLKFLSHYVRLVRSGQ